MYSDHATRVAQTTVAKSGIGGKSTREAIAVLYLERTDAAIIADKPSWEFMGLCRTTLGVFPDTTTYMR